MSTTTAARKVWTFDDLLALPDEVGRWWEIVDGALVVTPAPAFAHEWACAAVRRMLDAAGLPDFVAIGPIGVDLHPTYRQPDVVVVSTALRGRRTPAPVAPADVLLAVEVVSPSSVTTDRVTKPAEYAAAGIRHFWRIETDPAPTLTVYRLDADATRYTEIGTWRTGETAHLAEPYPVEVVVDSLV